MIMLYCWTDIETGGLNGWQDNGKLGEQHYPILEIAIILTKKDLSVVGKFHSLVKVGDNELARMSDFARRMHDDNGLIEECKGCPKPLHVVEREILDFLRHNNVRNFSERSTSGELAMLAGSSIHYDRSFIRMQMPKLDKYLFYRMLDVSSIMVVSDKEVEPYDSPHRAIPDVTNSVKLFKFLTDKNDE